MEQRESDASRSRQRARRSITGDVRFSDSEDSKQTISLWIPEKSWISGPHKDGEDRLYVSNIHVEIDDDVREEYWTEIRNKPEFKARKQT
jgi:hypothetical protein